MAKFWHCWILFFVLFFNSAFVGAESVIKEAESYNNNNDDDAETVYIAVPAVKYSDVGKIVENPIFGSFHPDNFMINEGINDGNINLTEKVDVGQKYLNVSEINEEEKFNNTTSDSNLNETKFKNVESEVKGKDLEKEFFVTNFWTLSFSAFKDATKANADKLEHPILDEKENGTVGDANNGTNNMFDKNFIGLNETTLNNTENAFYENEIQTETELFAEINGDGQEYDYNGIITNKMFSEKNTKESETFESIFLSPESVDKNDNLEKDIQNVTLENGKQNYPNNEMLELNIVDNFEDANSTYNETSKDFFEGSADNDDEDGDADVSSSESDNIPFTGEPIMFTNFAPEFESTTLPPKKVEQKMKEIHKCYCSEVEGCLSEVWESYKEESDENLLTKCSVTFLKDDCSLGGSSEKRLIDSAENGDDEILETCPRKENKQILFNKQMLKCFNQKSCFLQNSELLFNKIRPFCIAKVKKLTILNALKLSKEEIMSLKGEYERTFAEEFEDGRIENPGRNIFTRWFYRMRNKFCDTF